MSMFNNPENTQPADAERKAEQPRQAAGGSTGLFFFLILAVAAGVLAAVLFFKPSQPGGGTLSGLALQPVSEEGSAVSLADLKGQVVLLNFWGTWCGPCIEELPDIVAIHEKYGGRDDFRLLAVSCGTSLEDEQPIDRLRQATQAFLDQRGLTLPTYVDPDGATRQAAAEALGGQLPGYPTTILLDRDHGVQQRWLGAQSFEKFDTAIQRALDEE